MPLLLMLWCNVVKRNWIIILMQTVLRVFLLAAELPFIKNRYFFGR